MSVYEILSSFNNIPYSVLQKFIEDSLNDSQYRNFIDRSVKAMKHHDPKGFRIDYILRDIFCGDYDEIVKFIKDNEKWI